MNATQSSMYALFEPRGVLIAGVSSHPGKFGFVALHNVLSSGYRGAVYATNRNAETVLGVNTVRDVAELPNGAIDLVIVCTPAATNATLLRACAAKGIRAAFVASAGYGEIGGDGVALQNELVALADELDMLIAGPNGQGLVSTPAQLCAQIVAPYPPAGRIGIASQSGNLVSSFCNWSRASGVGVSRAVSAGNAATVAIIDYLEFYAIDSRTDVALAYVEHVAEGRAFFERAAKVTAQVPVVLFKGGSTAAGAQAALSHTGALAADDRIFHGACRQVGINRASTVEEAFDAAAFFATQPVPQGPNTVVLTAAGGWGVVAADAIARERSLHLMALPTSLLEVANGLLPPRWSRANPVDLAGGEQRDTIPQLLDALVDHPDVHAVIYLGMGIQANQARLMREGRFGNDADVARIVEYHERQDRRFAHAAIDASKRSGKPVLVASELATADPANAGVEALAQRGGYCFSSAERAVRALAHGVRYGAYRSRTIADAISLP